MKGRLHTDELLGAVAAPSSALHTRWRVNHVCAMDVPRYHKPLMVTDAAINISPTLARKRDIGQNAVDLPQVMGVATPHAAALTVIAMRGRITGARVDGPLALDNAISLNAARTKHITSPMAGSAGMLPVPDLDGADAAGRFVGVRVPIILASRADSLRVCLASAALGRLAGARQRVSATLCSDVNHAFSGHPPEKMYTHAPRKRNLPSSPGEKPEREGWSEFRVGKS